MASVDRVQNLKTMLVQEPEDLFLNYALAMEYLKDSDTYEQAREQFQKTLQLNPVYVPAFYQLGKLFELLGNPEEALKYYRQGRDLAKQQNNNKAFNEFGEAIFMLED